MRPQKPKNRKRKLQDNSKTLNHFKGYFLSDMDCKYCVNYRGLKRGCRLSECDFDEEKLDAIKHGRIKRMGSDVI